MDSVKDIFTQQMYLTLWGVGTAILTFAVYELFKEHLAKETRRRVLAIAIFTAIPIIIFSLYLSQFDTTGKTLPTKIDYAFVISYNAMERTKVFEEFILSKEKDLQKRKEQQVTAIINECPEVFNGFLTLKVTRDNKVLNTFTDTFSSNKIKTYTVNQTGSRLFVIYGAENGESEDFDIDGVNKLSELDVCTLKITIMVLNNPKDPPLIEDKMYYHIGNKTGYLKLNISTIKDNYVNFYGSIPFDQTNKNDTTSSNYAEYCTIIENIHGLIK